MSDSTDDLKRQAAARALEEVRDGMVLGLGTGSTVSCFLELLAARLGEGGLSGVVGVPTSVRTEREGRALGISMTSLWEHEAIDLTVDGADEVDPGLDLVKGMGGALLREKMVAQASRSVVIIADEGKAVERLGTRSPLPVEVVDWAWRSHARFMEARGAEVALRFTEDRFPFKTDNGNLLLECTFPEGIEDAHALEAALASRSGVVESGLFLGIASRVFLAGPGGVRVLERSA